MLKRTPSIENANDRISNPCQLTLYHETGWSLISVIFLSHSNPDLESCSTLPCHKPSVVLRKAIFKIYLEAYSFPLPKCTSPCLVLLMSAHCLKSPQPPTPC